MIFMTFKKYWIPRALKNIGINSFQLFIHAAVSILLFSVFVSGVTAEPQPNKYYFRIETNKLTDNNDLEVSKLGALAIKENMVGHVDLAYLESDVNGNALALELGGGFAYNWYVSPYISLGVSLGYNWDKEEFIAAYYPEVGVVADISKSFGVTLSGKRYYSLYEEDEDIVMLGLVFRK
jgi:hypothetical protein